MVLTLINRVVYTIIAVVIVITIREFVNIDSYMDEVFHYPQVENYCQGNYSSWNPKITTYPGLYMTSVLFIKLTNLFFFHTKCTLTEVRCHNLIISIVILLPCLLCLSRKMRSNYLDDLSYSLTALLFVFPISFFYYFLYYTDTASLAYFLLTYTILCYRDISMTIPGKLLVTLTGSLSIYARQTNAIWILFLIGIQILEDLTRSKLFRDDYPTDVKQSLLQIIKFISCILKNLISVLYSVFPIILPVLYFAVYALRSGSIVSGESSILTQTTSNPLRCFHSASSGDKEHHVPVLHLAMPLHGLFISSLVTNGIHMIQMIYDIYSSPSYSQRRKIFDYIQFTTWEFIQVASVIRMSLGVAMCSWILRNYCLPHPFILADNRHYTFYVWRRLLQYPMRRTALGPIYYLSVSPLLRNIAKSRGFVWLLIYLIALCLSLIPAHLLELRYFTPGTIILLLNYSYIQSYEIKVKQDDELTATSKSHESVVGMIAMIWIFLSVNIVVLYVFLFKPYTWNDGSLARFMF